MLKDGLRWIFHTNSKWIECEREHTNTIEFGWPIWRICVNFEFCVEAISKYDVNWFRQRGTCEANDIKYSLFTHLQSPLHGMFGLLLCPFFSSVCSLSSNCTFYNFHILLVFMCLRPIHKQSTFFTNAYEDGCSRNV